MLIASTKTSIMIFVINDQNWLISNSIYPLLIVFVFEGHTVNKPRHKKVIQKTFLAIANSL